MSTYALVAIIKKELDMEQTMYEILQILSISLFDKTALQELFPVNKNKLQNADPEKQLQLNIF